MRLGNLVLVAVLALVPVACDSDDGDDNGGFGGFGGFGGGAPVEVSEETFVQAMVQAMCSGGPTCCPQQGKTYDDLACHTTASLFFAFFGLTQGQAKTYGLEWDQAAAEACVANLRQASESCGGTDWDDTPCNQLYSPNVQPGAPCEVDMQCIPPPNGRAECEWTPENDQYCIQIDFVGEGAGCSSISTECDPSANLFCEGESGTATCVARKAAGASCYSDEQCLPDLRCDADMCAVRAAIGEACGEGADCASGNCVDQVCQAPLDVGCL